MATQSTRDRIDRLYSHWVGYPIIAECGEDPRAAINILREYRAAIKESDNEPSCT